MRYLLAFLLLFPLAAWAETGGPGTTLAWDYEEPLPADVTGFRVYGNGVLLYETSNRTVTDAELGLTEGTYEFYVTAYQDVQAGEDRESLPSNTVMLEYVTDVPVPPANLRFPN